MDQEYRVIKFMTLLRDEGAWVQPFYTNRVPLVLVNSLPATRTCFSPLFLTYVLPLYFSSSSSSSWLKCHWLSEARIWTDTEDSCHSVHTKSRCLLQTWQKKANSHLLLTIMALSCNHQVEWRRSNPNLGCHSLCTGKVNSKAVVFLRSMYKLWLLSWLVS